ncbi:MAG: hypothetical protein QXH92_04510 [Candidatus Aenigmatarchaeota archaeon]
MREYKKFKKLVHELKKLAKLSSSDDEFDIINKLLNNGNLIDPKIIDELRKYLDDNIPKPIPPEPKKPNKALTQFFTDKDDLELPFKSDSDNQIDLSALNSLLNLPQKLISPTK